MYCTVIIGKIDIETWQQGASLTREFGLVWSPRLRLEIPLLAWLVTVTLQWRHMSAMMSQITTLDCLFNSSGDTKTRLKRLCITGLCEENCRWPVDSPWTAPSHYLNQCWNIVDRTLGNKLQWNFNRNSNIFIQENAFENVCEMASNLSRPQGVKLASGQQ